MPSQGRAIAALFFDRLSYIEVAFVKALGMTIPPSLLAQADEVIE